jgi:uncharacterized protein YPO0396
MTTLNQLKKENLNLAAEAARAIAAAEETADLAARAINSRNDYAELASSLKEQVDSLRGLDFSLAQENAELRQANAQLHSNLMAFRDRFKARVSEMQMESRQLDIAELLKT